MQRPHPTLYIKKDKTPMSQVPNVLAIRGSTLLGSGTSPVHIQFKNGIPNIKKNRAFYLTFVESSTQTTFRVHHIARCEEVDSETLKFTVGNSFVTEVEIEQPLGREYAYYPLTAFGLQQIAPGTLIKLIRTPAKGGVS